MRSRREADADPGALARELGKDRYASAFDEVPAETGEADYCSFCWTALPPAAAECPDCGRTVAEMEAARAAVAEADRRWTPPRLADGPQYADDYGDYDEPFEEAPAPATVAPAPASRKPARPPRALLFGWGVIERCRPLALGLVLTTSLFASGFAGQWLAVATFPKSTLDPEKLAEMTARMPARVRWRRFSPDLRVVLLTRKGEVIARSTDKDPAGGRRIRPGVYKVRVTDKSRGWKTPDSEVTAYAGRSALVGPTPEQEAKYHMWMAEQFLRRNRREEARAHLDKAHRLAPQEEQTRRKLRALTAKAA